MHAASTVPPTTVEPVISVLSEAVVVTEFKPTPARPMPAAALPSPTLQRCHEPTRYAIVLHDGRRAVVAEPGRAVAEVDALVAARWGAGGRLLVLVVAAVVVV